MLLDLFAGRTSSMNNPVTAPSLLLIRGSKPTKVVGEFGSIGTSDR